MNCLQDAEETRHAKDLAKEKAVRNYEMENFVRLRSDKKKSHAQNAVESLDTLLDLSGFGGAKKQKGAKVECEICIMIHRIKVAAEKAPTKEDKATLTAITTKLHLFPSFSASNESSKHIYVFHICLSFAFGSQLAF